MSLVASALLPLGEATGMQERYGVQDRAVASTGLEIVDRPLDLGLVVAEDPDGQDRSHAAQVPVRPVVGDVGTIVPDQEILVHWPEHIQHHGLELREVEARVGTHDLASVGKLVPVDPGGQPPVGAASDLCELVRPGVQNVTRCVSVRGVAADLPAQRVLVGGGDIIVQDPVVLPDAAPRTIVAWGFGL